LLLGYQYISLYQQQLRANPFFWKEYIGHSHKYDTNGRCVDASKSILPGRIDWSLHQLQVNPFFQEE
jgi:hypothetical protein